MVNRHEIGMLAQRSKLLHLHPNFFTSTYCGLTWTFVWSSSTFARFAWQLQKRHAARASTRQLYSGAGAPCQKTCQSGRWGARACTAVLLLCDSVAFQLSFIQNLTYLPTDEYIGWNILKIKPFKKRLLCRHKSAGLMSCDRCGADNRNKININTSRPRPWTWYFKQTGIDKRYKWV